MIIQIPADMEQQLAQLAMLRNTDAGTLALRAVDHMLEDERLHANVESARASLARGNFMTHEEVGQRLDKMFQV